MIILNTAYIIAAGGGFKGSLGVKTRLISVEDGYTPDVELILWIEHAQDHL